MMFGDSFMKKVGLQGDVYIFVTSLVYDQIWRPEVVFYAAKAIVHIFQPTGKIIDKFQRLSRGFWSC